MASLRLCSIDGCGKPVAWRGWCRKHYDLCRPCPACSVEGCGRPAKARGFCSTHYRQTDKTCSVPGCGRVVFCRGWCGPHYKRNWEYGDPEAGGVLKGDGAAWVEANKHHAGDECLDWPFGQSHGYGMVTINGQHERVHRIMCEVANGPAPEGLQAAHNCGRPVCVNPRHLRWATPKENSDDRIIHGTTNRGERHGMSKLTADDVLRIRRLLPRHTRREIADLFDVTPSNITAIATGRNWSWL